MKKKIIKLDPDPKYLPRPGYYHSPKSMKCDDKPEFHKHYPSHPKLNNDEESK